MNQKFYSILLTALFGLLGMNAWALSTTTIDGKTYYKISSDYDMQEFSELVNNGETTANAILTADIDLADLCEMEGWTAIGDWNTGDVTSAYRGHFNGQGHTIKGFNATSNKNYFGIFGVVSEGCLIENFTIYGTITLNHKTGGVVGYSRDATPTIRNIKSYLNINSTADGYRPGGILGSAVNGTTVVENCTYFGTINAGGHTGNIGGIVGYVNNNALAIVNITNCLFDGKILNGTTAEGQCGGIVGYNNAGVVTIKNCLSIGTITSEENNIGQFFGRLNANNSKFENCYYVGDFVNGTEGAGTASGSTPVKVTAEQLASGEIAYALNGNQSEEVNWFQTLSNTNSYPTPYGTDIVYLNGRQHCDGTAYEGVSYSNEDLGMVQDEHDYVDGFCSYCEALDANYLTANDDDFFEIANEKQLLWFAAYVNQVSVAANALLTADIALTKAWTNTIGTGSGNAAPGATAYTGTFDGQGYSITGFNAEGVGHLGLFGDASGATIKNFSISGNLTVTGGYGGGVVAWPINTTIENVHASLVVNVPNSGTHHVGGLVGSARGNNTINRCSFDGSLTVVEGSTDNFAGIAAYITNGDKVTNCANYGNVTFKDAGCAAGGVVGYVNAQQAYVQNCLSTGTILFNGTGDPKYGAAILGRTKGYAAEKVTNNYWLEGSAYAASKKDDGSDPLAVGNVTAAQLASGEVAYKLGEAWYQLIGTDTYPVLDPTSPKVYEIAVTAAGYATFVPTENVLAIPEGVTAYVGQQYDTYIHLEEVTELPADNAFILKANEGAYYYNCTEEARTITADNDLLFSDTDVVADGTQYVIAMVDDEIAFYQVNEGSTIAARKAYITCSSGVKAFFFDDDATGISNVNVNANEKIYNLAGQRLNKMQKGINIVGNKKVLY